MQRFFGKRSLKQHQRYLNQSPYNSLQVMLIMLIIRYITEVWRLLWSTPEKSEQLPLAVRWPDQPPTLQPQSSSSHIDAQSWTALFRAFSSHRQPSASLIKGIPQLDKPLGRIGQTLMACTVAEAL